MKIHYFKNISSLSLSPSSSAAAGGEELTFQSISIDIITTGNKIAII
jgi:hypothetical protein